MQLTPCEPCMQGQPEHVNHACKGQHMASYLLVIEDMLLSVILNGKYSTVICVRTL